MALALIRSGSFAPALVCFGLVWHGFVSDSSMPLPVARCACLSLSYRIISVLHCKFSFYACYVCFISTSLASLISRHLRLCLPLCLSFCLLWLCFCVCPSLPSSLLPTLAVIGTIVYLSRGRGGAGGGPGGIGKVFKMMDSTATRVSISLHQCG